MSDTAELTERGWPRPIIGGWPIAWVTPPDALSKTNPDRHGEVIVKKLCQVCGEGHGPNDIAYVLVKDKPLPDADISWAWAQAMDDGVLHERCLRLAVGRCPKLKALRAAGELAIIACPAHAIRCRADGEEGGRLMADGDHCTVLDTEGFLS